jgi:TonB family protein
MPKARVRLTLIESTRRTTLHAVAAELFGISTYAALVAVSIIGARALHRIAPTPLVDEAVRFLAPLRRSAPPPVQESIQFIGLGGWHAVSIPVIETSPHGKTPVPRGSLGHVAGEVLDLPDASNDSEKAYSEIEVDSTVTLDPSAEGPQYPPALLKAGVQGVVYARFVVDTVGHVDTASLVVMDKPDPEFVNAVRTALVRMKYRPAILRGRAVAQLVEQPFVFRIQDPQGAGPH